MKKQPLFLYFTDIHVDDSNHPHVYQIIKEIINHGKKLKCKTLIFGGDWFQQRVEQSEANLLFTKEMFELLNGYFNLHIIPGNHDKTDYESHSSFLDLFRINLYSEPTFINHDLCFRFHFVPYYKEDTIYAEALKELKISKDKRNILFTHVAVTGVKNNGGREVQNSLTSDLFDKFEKVIIGHYHNAQSFKNFLYPGSTDQRNFGETWEDKGLHVFYEDLSYETINLAPRKYETYYFNSITEIDNFTPRKDINQRVIIEGNFNEQAKRKILELKEQGIKVVDKTYKSLTQELDSASVNKSIPQLFDDFVKNHHDPNSTVVKNLKNRLKCIS